MVFDEEKGVLVNSKVLLMTSVYFGIHFWRQRNIRIYNNDVS